MPDQQALHNLLNLHVDSSAPVITIYADRLTPRLEYTCGFIFNHVLKVNFLITSNLTTAQASDHCIYYSDQSANGSLNIKPQGLLAEQGFSPEKPEAFFNSTSIYFYKTQASDNGFPFDVFSAVFYFISRYEEWQPFVRDAHGRFEAKESLLHQHNAHLKPVVDGWVYELKAALTEKYPTLVFPVVAFKAISTIDVDNLFAYKHKGFLRTAGACVKDVVKLDFKNLISRLRVVAGLEKDPFDVYEKLATFSAEQKFDLVFFFLFRTGTTYDRTVNPQSLAFKRVLELLKNKKIMAGLHPSYDTAFEKGLMEKEVKDFSKSLGTPVTMSRQHFLRFDIITTPPLLMQQGIQADFSMGFASSTGFRAGTSQPFFYYDLKTEKKEALLFVPFCSMDGAYFVYDSTDAETAYKSLWDLAQEIKKVNGLFITVFHERTFSDHLYRGFGTLYKKLHLNLKEL